MSYRDNVVVKNVNNGHQIIIFSRRHHTFFEKHLPCQYWNNNVHVYISCDTTQSERKRIQYEDFFFKFGIYNSTKMRENPLLDDISFNGLFYLEGLSLQDEI